MDIRRFGFWDKICICKTLGGEHEFQDVLVIHIIVQSSSSCILGSGNCVTGYH